MQVDVAIQVLRLSFLFLSCLLEKRAFLDVMRPARSCFGGQLAGAPSYGTWRRPRRDFIVKFSVCGRAAGAGCARSLAPACAACVCAARVCAASACAVRLCCACLRCACLCSPPVLRASPGLTVSRGGWARFPPAASPAIYDRCVRCDIRLPFEAPPRLSGRIIFSRRTILNYTGFTSDDHYKLKWRPHFRFNQAETAT